jgi:lysozyme
MGADVSEYEDTIDFGKMATEKQFVFIRASHGLHHDATYLDNWSEAKKYGIVRGAYHYIDPTEDYASQVRYFVKTVKLEKGDFYPVLDLENPPLWAHIKQADRIKYVLKWVHVLERVYGVKPIIYMSPSFVDKVLGVQEAEALKHYPLWVAHYRVAYPWIPAPWNSYIIWQYSEHGKCQGVASDCDTDVAPGTLADLQVYTMSTAAGGNERLLAPDDLDDGGISAMPVHKVRPRGSDSQHGRHKHPAKHRGHHHKGSGGGHSSPKGARHHGHPRHH